MHVFEAWLHLFHPRRSNNHRPRILHAEGLALLLLLAVGFAGLLSISNRAFPTVTSGILGYATSISADQVVAQTNAKRAELGLAPLQTSGVLARAAQLKAADMFTNQYWAHTSPQGKEPWDFIRSAGYSYQAAGENLARDFMWTEEMVNAWMNSPTHRANIVNARYQEIGIAVVNGSLEGTDTTLVVQMFGRPRTTQAAVAPAAATQRPAPVTAVPQVNAAPAVPAATATPVPVQASPEPAAEPTPIPQSLNTPEPQPALLSAMSVIRGSIRPWPVVSPMQLTKAFFLSILVLIIATLSYDWALVHKSPRARLVGRNLAHILFFAAIIFLLVSFHSGAIQ